MTPYRLLKVSFLGHEVPVLLVRNNLPAGARVIKRTIDILGAASLLTLLSPLFAVIAILIKAGGGNVFFGHTRIGRQGEPFPCFKFRTMVPNAEEILKGYLAENPEAKAEWERDFKLKNDPRVTAIGAFLRKTSLDELPQLWNVLRGEMSLVGSRPITEAELSRYGDHVGVYLGARPGLTGLWQVSGRSDVDYDERVSMDTWYARNWSLWQDVTILFKTAKVVVNGRGAY